MQTGAKKAGGTGHEPVPHSKHGDRAHHVELVISRILAKQRGDAKRSSRCLDLENGSE